MPLKSDIFRAFRSKEPLLPRPEAVALLPEGMFESLFISADLFSPAGGVFGRFGIVGAVFEFLEVVA